MAKRDVRYGSELRKRAAKADSMRRSRFTCPACGKKKVKRKGNSLWECKSCNKVFAGGTYSLTTPTGEVMMRIISEHSKR